MLSHTFMCQILAKTILSRDFEQNGQKCDDLIRRGAVPAAPVPALQAGPPAQRPLGPGPPRGPFRHSSRRGVARTAALLLPRSGGERLEGKFERFHTLLCAKFSQKRFLAGTSSKADNIPVA